MVPLDGRPGLTSNVVQWHGDARGRWEGDTLVVESANYLAAGAFRGATEDLRLVERFTRVGPDTIHRPRAEGGAARETETIGAQATIVCRGLREDFGITEPRLEVAALNPHAGEGGALGTEETAIIQPAIEILRDRGVDVTGPSPADSLFHEAARAAYDAVICMYHDQALIPLKTLNFEQGVNITLGLPFVRTSPDHGTALGIAGTGKANPASLIAALEMASAIGRRRAAVALPALQV